MPIEDLSDAQRRFLEKYLNAKIGDGIPVPPPDPGLEKARLAWEAAAPDVAERVRALLARDAPNAAKVEAAWKQAETLALNEDYAKAVEATKKIGAVIDQIEKASGPEDAQGVGGVSLVKLGIARAEWPKVQSAAHSGIETIKAKLRDAYAPYPNESAKVAAAVSRIDRVIDTLNDALKDQLDDVYNAQDEASRAKTIAVVRKTVSQFKSFVDSDPVASAIDGNSFAPEIAPIGPVRKNLDAMMAALGG